MELLKTVREVGFFETGRNLTQVLDSGAVRAQAEAVMPLPAPNLADAMERIAGWLSAFRKEKYLFLTPEIALVELLAARNPEQEAMLLVPCGTEEEVRARLEDNLPRQMRTSLLEEPFFPREFYPDNGIIIACGYLAGSRAMVLPETYRIIDHYTAGFYGKKVFIPYAELSEGTRYEGWIEVSMEKFSRLWRDA